MSRHSPKEVVPGLYRVDLGFVNAYLLIAEAEKPVTIVDTGSPGNAPKILAAIAELGRTPADVAAIVLTHAHIDHSGSAEALRRATGAPIYAHELDADLLAEGRVIRPYVPAPHPVLRFMVAIARTTLNATMGPLTVDERLAEGQSLSFWGGVTVVHLPGHCAGQIGLLSPRAGGVLVGGDVATNFVNLSYAIIYEDLETGLASARRVGDLKCQVVCLGHGRPLRRNASARFAARFRR